MHQDETQRYILLRLSRPAPGIVLIGTYGVGDTTNASITCYWYGNDAEHRATTSGPKWRDWLGAAFKRL
ncbi:hypothetical protein ACYJL1_20250 (plasmid) [Phyllobacterium sp. K27]